MRVLKNLSFSLILAFSFIRLSGQALINIHSDSLWFPDRTLRFSLFEFNESAQIISFPTKNLKVNIDQWPVFCRWEEKWRQKYHLPVKFRLGSIDYVDFLENK